MSFAVATGEIFGILGPNGAGKSTTLEIIEGLREPDPAPNTTIRVAGLDVRERKQRDELHQRIGLQLQTSALFRDPVRRARVGAAPGAPSGPVRAFFWPTKSRSLDTCSMTNQALLSSSVLRVSVLNPSSFDNAILHGLYT